MLNKTLHLHEPVQPDMNDTQTCEEMTFHNKNKKIIALLEPSSYP